MSSLFALSSTRTHARSCWWWEESFCSSFIAYHSMETRPILNNLDPWWWKLEDKYVKLSLSYTQRGNIKIVTHVHDWVGWVYVRGRNRCLSARGAHPCPCFLPPVNVRRSEAMFCLSGPFAKADRRDAPSQTSTGCLYFLYTLTPLSPCSWLSPLYPAHPCLPGWCISLHGLSVVCCLTLLCLVWCWYDKGWGNKDVLECSFALRKYQIHKATINLDFAGFWEPGC